MTKAAQALLSAFKTLPKKAQREVLITLLREPLEKPYTTPTDEELRRAADAVFLDLDHRETQI